MRFTFPQQNGDVFAFTEKVNREFVHGVPKQSVGRSMHLEIDFNCFQRVSMHLDGIEFIKTWVCKLI